MIELKHQTVHYDPKFDWTDAEIDLYFYLYDRLVDFKKELIEIFDEE